MALDKRVGSKLPNYADKSKAPGQRFDPGPYVGIVKRTVDSTRKGRIHVYIPELGGNNPEDESAWFTVSYASPFGGATRPTAETAANAFGFTPQSYGFWMIPPDIGNEVLVIFVNGDMNRGFWFACVNSDLSQYMTPGIASSDKVDLASVPPELAKTVTVGKRYPVVEFNIKNEASYNEAFYANPKPLHLPQFVTLLRQGLEDDVVRGTIGSSSQRETPSNVFGFSTPGRPYGIDPAENPELLKKIADATVELGDIRAVSRKGGHVFVMDDGDIKGEDQLVRIRTATGHQILLHDTEQTIYIGNANGASWVELTKDGQVLIYGTKGFSVRTKGPMNFHSDTLINFNAGAAIKMYAGKGIAVETPGGIGLTGTQGINLAGSSIGCKADVSFSASAATSSVTGLGTLTLKSSGKTTLTGSINTINGGVVNILGGVGGGVAGGAASGAQFGAARLFGGSGVQKYNLPDVERNGDGKWVVKPGALKSIVTVAPTHEPYNRSTVAELAAVDTDANGNPIYATEAGDAVGPKNAKGSGSGTGRQAPSSAYLKQPDPPGGIGGLDQEEVKAYMAQVGHSESGGNYSSVNTYGYLGKYQMGAGALIDGGYVKPGTTNSGLSNPNNWTGKDGVTSRDDFLANPSIQEANMYNYTVRNYNALAKTGVITSQSSSDDIAGLLSVSHLLGAGGAKKWYNGQGGADAYGTTGDMYYNLGRYSQQGLLASTKPSTTIG